MTDLDQLLKDASTDVKTSLRTVSTPSPEKIHRRAQRRSATKATAVVVLVVSLGASAWLLSRGSDGSFTGGDALITSEVILQDGVVTEEELRAGAEAVVACVADAGFEAEVDFDDASPGFLDFSGSGAGGGPGFWTEPGGNEALDGCLEVHLSRNVMLGWAVTQGRLDLDELRAEDSALVECVERLTDVDFGEVTHDDFGYLTNDGQQTRDAAFEYQDHGPWQTCKQEPSPATSVGSSTSTAPSTTPTTFTPIVAPDGVTYIEPATQITVINGLTLVVQESNIGPCLQVRVEGGMAGGCGDNFDDPLNVGFGFVGGKSFTSGWAPVGTFEVVITLADGEIVSVTTLHSVEEYDVWFFLALMPSPGNDFGRPPIEATAFDANGSPLASVSYGN